MKDFDDSKDQYGEGKEMPFLVGTGHRSEVDKENDHDIGTVAQEEQEEPDAATWKGNSDDFRDI